MRATAVRDKIREALLAITPDSVAHAGDKFNEAPPSLDYAPRDRTFILSRTQPQAPSYLLFAGADPYEIVFELGVTYLPTPTAQDRILADGDRVVDAIKLLELNNAQILKTELVGSADFEDDHGNRLCTWTLRVIYDRRDA